MSPIPDDHTAARDLERAFVELGRRRAEASGPSPQPQPPRRRRRPARRVLVLAALATVGLAAVAGGAAIFTGDGAPKRSDRGAPPASRPLPPGLALAAASAADPSGALPWGVRVFESRAGGRCVVAGQVRDGVLGVFAGGAFAALPADSQNACAPAGEHIVIAARSAPGGGAPRTILVGTVDRTVRSMRIVGAAGPAAVKIAADGSFILVRLGANALRGDTLVVSTDGGELRRPLG